MQTATDNNTPSVGSDVLDIFNNAEFESTLKALAVEFGDEATLKNVYESFINNRRVPERVVNGVTYLAGYKGRLMVPEGTIKATLIDIKEVGQNIKLMFSPVGTSTFLYHSFAKTDIRIDQIVKLATNIGNEFKIHVEHETIPATGDKHAVIDVVQGLGDLIS